MVETLGILQFLLIGYICVFEFKNKSSSVFLWATLFLMFGFMHLITSFTGDINYSNRVLGRASIFVICFCAFYLFVRATISKKIIVSNRFYLDYFRLKQEIHIQKEHLFFLVLLFSISVLGRILPMIRYSGNIFNMSWGSMRSYSEGLSYANSSQIFTIIFYALSGLTIVTWVMKKYVTTAFLFCLLIFGVVITRNRVEVLPLLCAIIVVFILKHRQIQPSVFLFAIISIILVVFVVYGLRAMRYYGGIGDFISKFSWDDFLSQIQFFLESGDGELGLRKYFYYFLSRDNNFSEFGTGATYIRMLFVFIPTSWSFGLKPDDFAQTMGSAIGMASGGSMHPTLFGDCYANLGDFGILLGIFWAIFVSCIDWITIRQKNSVIMTLLYLLCSVGYCIIARGAVYNGFWNIAWGTILLLVLSYLLNHINLPRVIFKR